MNRNWLWALIVLFFLITAAGSYYFMHNFTGTEKQPQSSPAQAQDTELTDFSALRIYQPRDSRIVMTEKKIPKRISNTGIAEAVVEEFFKRTGAGEISPVPQNVKFLGLYKDEENILYIDLSDEVRRNFQGDAMSEYLFLKGLYESLASNVQDFQDIKILVEGHEIETLGGHFYLKYPLKNMLSVELRGEAGSKNE